MQKFWIHQNIKTKIMDVQFLILSSIFKGSVEKLYLKKDIFFLDKQTELGQ